jgi:hypothetical protein
VYTASWQSSSAYCCNRPKLSRRATALGSISETWFSDLQSLESGSEKILQTVIDRHIVIRWLYVVMVYSDIEAERVLLSEITPDI